MLGRVRDYEMPLKGHCCTICCLLECHKCAVYMLSASYSSKTHVMKPLKCPNLRWQHIGLFGDPIVKCVVVKWWSNIFLWSCV